MSKAPGIVLLCLLICGTCSATKLIGTVRSKDGKPVRGVLVYSFNDQGIMAPSEGRHFFQKTDAAGRFRLRGHGELVSFRHRDFQPLSKTIDYAARRLEVVLETRHDTRNVRACSNSVDYQEHKSDYVEIQDFLILFLPREKNVAYRKISDVDYVLHLFAYGSIGNEIVMQGWFGLNATGEYHYAKFLRKSSNVNERWVKFGDHDFSEIFGQTSDQKHWRYLSFGSSALFYHDASDDVAAVFDTMLEKMCYETRRM
jgi:hypothetical protein